MISVRPSLTCCYNTGVREQPGGERRARRPDRARRQLRRQQYGARATDTHTEHAGLLHL